MADQTKEAVAGGEALATMVDAYKDGVRAFARWAAKHWQVRRSEWEPDGIPAGDYVDGFNAGIESVEHAVDVFFDEVI